MISAFSLITLGMVIFFGLVYYALPIKQRWLGLFFATVVMILCLNNIYSAIFMLCSLLINYGCGIGIEKTEGKWKNTILLLGIIYNLFFMGWLKTFSEVLPDMGLIAPLGISYHTFTSIGYLIDVKREMSQAEKNPLRYITYAGFFPTLLSGPIMTYGEMKEKLFCGHKFDYQRVIFGMQRVLWGLFKKMVISDRVAVVVNAVYGDYVSYSGFYILIAFLLFPIQLYADFSGCIDIIMGIAEMFGIDLPDNFNLPFLAQSVAEFWRRWHITLGQWLRNYLFYSLLRTKLFKKLGSYLKKHMDKKTAAKIPTWICLMITWICIGVWHKGSMNCIFGVGIFFGLIIVLSEMLAPFFNKVKKRLGINTECFSFKAFRVIRTYLLFAAGNSFFMAGDGLISGFMMWKSMLTEYNPWIWVDGSLLTLGLDRAEWFVLFVAIAVVIAAGVVKSHIQTSVREWIYSQNLLFGWIIWLGIILAIIMWGWYGEGYTVQAFIYQQF